MRSLAPLEDRSLAERVADQLRDAIRSGDLAPGTRLVERTLARELNVSHIPVREALARLGEEGLVERSLHRTSRVASLTVRQLEDISSLRIVLEQFVVARAQQHLTPGREIALRRIVERMSTAASAADRRRLWELDLRFHEELWRLSEHPPLQEVVAELRGRIEAFLRVATQSLDADALHAHAEAHAHLLDAITTYDRDIACQEMTKHIEAAAHRIRQTLSGHEATNG
jgi:DNA-binding GntR family transcriptional regulator